LEDKLIPFLDRYPLLGVKNLEYLNFLEAIELFKNKAHLTLEGLEQIRTIKSGMNTGRLNK
jgi:hypothetical protein